MVRIVGGDEKHHLVCEKRWEGRCDANWIIRSKSVLISRYMRCSRDEGGKGSDKSPREETTRRPNDVGCSRFRG